MPMGSSCAFVEEKNVIVLTDSSLLSGNMFTGSSRAAKWGTKKCDFAYLHLQQL